MNLEFSGLPKGMNEPKEWLEVKLNRFPDPFPKDEISRKKMVAAMGEHFRKEFRRLLTKLEELLPLCNPLQTLGHFEFYDCTILERSTEEDYQPIEQFGIELLQALFLSVPRNTSTERVTSPEALLELNQTIHEFAYAYSMRDCDQGADNEQLKKADELSHQIRMHTFGIRNAGFQDQVLSQLRSLFGALDAEYQAQTGIKLTGLMAMWQQLVSRIENRINDRKTVLHLAFSAETAEEIIGIYCRNRGFDQSYERAMMEELRKHGGTPDMARQYCVQDWDRKIQDCFLFSIDDFVSAYPEPVNPSALAAVIDRWTFQPGDLVSHNREYFILSNPIWERPIIRLRPGRYFWPIIQIFHSFGLEMLEGLIAEFPEMKVRYEQRIRTDYLERRVREEFSRALPRAEIFAGAKWRDPLSGKLYETDLIAIMDEVFFVCECKSGRITQSARRGSPDRLRKEIKKLIEEAAIQSARLVELVQKGENKLTLNLSDGSSRILNSRDYGKFIRINATLDFFGPLACEARSMQAAGLFDPSVAGAPTLALVDIENLVELLDSPGQLLHYLARRSEIEQTMNFFADELDLLALYLATGFDLGEEEFKDENYFSFYGLSDQIEPYLYAKSGGQTVTKPKLKLTPYWKNLLKTFEQRRFRHWLLASFSLLGFGYETQEQFESHQEKMCERIRCTSPSDGEINTIMAMQEQQQTAIVAVGVRNISRDERIATIQNAIESAAEQTKCKYVLLICHEVFKREQPYSIAGFYIPNSV